MDDTGAEQTGAARFRRLEALYHRALERPEPEREPLLRAECGEDEALYGEARALLEEAGRMGGPLEEPAFDLALRLMRRLDP